MQTILYQGRPKEQEQWLVLPERFVSDYQRLDYQVRQLVLRAEAEKAKVECFNAALDQAEDLITTELGIFSDGAIAIVKKLRGLKLPESVDRALAARGGRSA